MFPHGVIYEGVSEEPLSFRGESGANDSMVSNSTYTSILSHTRKPTNELTSPPQIPLMDNLLQINMPSTPLTTILKDFRSYRPGNHRAFLEHVSLLSTTLDLKSFALATPTSRALYLLALNEVRDFRWRHWCFTREYILKKTTHPTATGGSPIVTWLPNQLGAVLKEMVGVWGTEEGEGMGSWRAEVEDVMEAAERQKEQLEKEVEKYCKERGVA
jgi:indoleamine 2,3-dioxygenase